MSHGFQELLVTVGGSGGGGDKMRITRTHEQWRHVATCTIQFNEMQTRWHGIRAQHRITEIGMEQLMSHYYNVHDIATGAEGEGARVIV